MTPTLTPEVRQAAKDAEEAFYAWAEEEGWEVFRNGWPDFLCIDRKGRVVCVEAKSGNAGLKPIQRGVLAILATAGLDCYIWSEASGLVPFMQRRAGLRVEGVIHHTHAHQKDGQLDTADRSGQGDEQEGLAPPQTFTNPPWGLPRRLWEAAGVGRNPI